MFWLASPNVRLANSAICFPGTGGLGTHDTRLYAPGAQNCSSRHDRIADIGQAGNTAAMLAKTFVPILATCLILSGCASTSSKLPPLLRDATTTGGSNFLCEGGHEQGSVPETASHSPEIVARLQANHPIGSRASELRASLLRQGFTIHDGCSADKSVSWAEFRQQLSGSAGPYTSAFGTVYWKKNAAGRLMWTTGDIAYTGL